MKTSQKSETFPPGKGISEAQEAQELLNFTRKFSDEQDRFPTLQELPRENDIIVYYFGSLEKLLRCAWLGQSPPPLRRDRKKRYCRYDNKVLPQLRWFFCNDDCERKFADENSLILTEDEIKIKGKVKKVRRRMWHKCKGCGEKCVIYLPESQDEPKAKVICKASPEYEEVNKTLLNEIKGK